MSNQVCVVPPLDWHCHSYCCSFFHTPMFALHSGICITIIYSGDRLHRTTNGRHSRYFSTYALSNNERTLGFNLILKARNVWSLLKVNEWKYHFNEWTAQWKPVWPYGLYQSVETITKKKICPKPGLFRWPTYDIFIKKNLLFQLNEIKRNIDWVCERICLISNNLFAK